MDWGWWLLFGLTWLVVALFAGVMLGKFFKNQ
jgi:hypothetical protein